MTITSLGNTRSPAVEKAKRAGLSRSEYLKLYSHFVTACCSPTETIHLKIKSPKVDSLLHAALGCGTEAGEFQDQIKKALVYGRELDEVNVKEELGDILWYIQLACNTLDCTILDLIAMNMRKREARYPGKFTAEAELRRDIANERNQLESNEGEEL